MLKCNAERIRKNIETLAGFTRTPGQGCTRLSYTKEFREAGHYIIEEMRSAGLTVREDAAGNIIGRLEAIGGEGTFPEASKRPVILTGSHFDSVPCGGNFDGAAGIFAALEAVRVMKEHKIIPAVPVEVIAMPEEEGSRFGGGLFASRAICSGVTADELRSAFDREGISQYEAMKSYGLDPDTIASVRRSSHEIAAYLELHIEQGPVLEQQQTRVGIVDSIVGLRCCQITVRGRADHAGTTPLPLRADALLASAKAITAATEAASLEGNGTVVTFGAITSGPAASNIVQSTVHFTADCRSCSSASIRRVMDAFEDSLKQSRQNVPGAAELSWEIQTTLDAPPVLMDTALKQLLSDTAKELHLPAASLPSGAGHDAMNFASLCPTAMIFVPSRGGRSHCPEEWTNYQQIADGADVLLHTLLKLFSHFRKNGIAAIMPAR